MIALTRRELSALAANAEEGIVVRGPVAYRPCPTVRDGTWMAWLCPHGVWKHMLGTDTVPWLWESSDMCSIVPETVGRTEAWVACYIHDWHYHLVRLGQMGRFRADFLFARNSYREIRARGGSILEARLAQARAWGTNLFGALPSWTRWPLIGGAVLALVWFLLLLAR